MKHKKYYAYVHKETNIISDRKPCNFDQFEIKREIVTPRKEHAEILFKQYVESLKF